MCCVGEGTDERAAEWVLSVMEGTADPSADLPERLDRSGRAAVEGYLRLFAADFDGAVAAVRSVDSPSAYLIGIRRQVDALCGGAVPDGWRFGGDLSTLAGAMEVFHVCEAAHVVGAIPEAIRLSTAALAEGVLPPRPRTWVRLALVRALLFQGEVDRATEELTLVRPDATTPIAQQSVRCLQAMASGLRGDRAAVVGVAEEMRSLILEPRGYAEAGLALLGAFGLTSCGLPAAAAELLRFGAGGPGLPLLPPTLRAYGYDLLVEAAAEAGNLELAEWILAEFDRMDLGPNQQMRAARDVARARVRIATGEVLEGVAAAEAAALRAAAARSELVGTRALLAAARVCVGSPDDARRVLALVDGVGTEELRSWVRRSLAPIGGSPRPLTGAGWDQLTPTQRVVARLAARGLRNQEIADLLVLSPRTVEIHVAGVLDGLGVANRVGIVGTAGVGRGLDTRLLGTLTARQREVALHLVDGRTNAEIARTVGVGVKTIEKHVSAVLRAVGAASRAAAVARLLQVER